ncbi:hypothetical protein MMC20_002078 [Loxospora ochrophaea]|nr:hypothetical protein [Loxospora ochrophaea]
MAHTDPTNDMLEAELEAALEAELQAEREDEHRTTLEEWFEVRPEAVLGMGAALEAEEYQAMHQATLEEWFQVQHEAELEADSKPHLDEERETNLETTLEAWLREEQEANHEVPLEEELPEDRKAELEAKLNRSTKMMLTKIDGSIGRLAATMKANIAGIQETAVLDAKLVEQRARIEHLSAALKAERTRLLEQELKLVEGLNALVATQE